MVPCGPALPSSRGEGRLKNIENSIRGHRHLYTLAICVQGSHRSHERCMPVTTTNLTTTNLTAEVCDCAIKSMTTPKSYSKGFINQGGDQRANGSRPLGHRSRWSFRLRKSNFAWQAQCFREIMMLRGRVAGGPSPSRPWPQARAKSTTATQSKEAVLSMTFP